MSQHPFYAAQRVRAARGNREEPRWRDPPRVQPVAGCWESRPVRRFLSPHGHACVLSAPADRPSRGRCRHRGRVKELLGLEDRAPATGPADRRVVEVPNREIGEEGTIRLLRKRVHLYASLDVPADSLLPPTGAPLPPMSAPYGRAPHRSGANHQTGRSTPRNATHKKAGTEPLVEEGVGHFRMVSRVVKALACAEFVFDGLDQGFAEGGRRLEAG